METLTLRAGVGRETGTRPSRRLRRTGQVPAVVYGGGLDPVTVHVDGRELLGVLHTEVGLNALITLKVDKDEYLTVVREIQRHPVRGEITHLDFIQVSLDLAIVADVGIDFTGIAVGLVDGGIVETVQGSVSIEALPNQIPGSIALDISEMRIGDSLNVSDLPEVEGVTYLSDLEATLVTMVVPRIVVVEEEEVEDEDLEEGELAEGAEGEEGTETVADTEAQG